MTYFKVKMFLVAALTATSAFASCVPQEDNNEGGVTRAPMRAGGFEILSPDVMGHLVSVMPVVPLDEARDLASVCKFFHGYVVPHMWFSWTPKGSSIPTEGKFAQSLAPRIVRLNLINNCTFTNTHLQVFTNLTDLILSRNSIITGDAVACLISLKRLNLTSNTGVRDPALKNLTNLTNLTNLNLCGNTVVTDASVRVDASRGAKSLR